MGGSGELVEGIGGWVVASAIGMINLNRFALCTTNTSTSPFPLTPGIVQKYHQYQQEATS